jgi:hypothetical protein
MDMTLLMGISEPAPRADYGVPQNNPDFESGPCIVTLSEAKGLSRSATRCFAAAQHDKAVTLMDVRFIF